MLLIPVSRRPGHTKVWFPIAVCCRWVVAFDSGIIFLTPPSLSPFTAWYRVSVQASVPERGEGAGQEGPGESHGAPGPAHLLTVSAWPPHRPGHPAQWLHREGGQGWEQWWHTISNNQHLCPKNWTFIFYTFSSLAAKSFDTLFFLCNFVISFLIFCLHIRINR